MDQIKGIDSYLIPQNRQSATGAKKKQDVARIRITAHGHRPSIHLPGGVCAPPRFSSRTVPLAWQSRTLPISVGSHQWYWQRAWQPSFRPLERPCRGFAEFPRLPMWLPLMAWTIRNDDDPKSGATVRSIQHSTTYRQYRMLPEIPG